MLRRARTASPNAFSIGIFATSKLWQFADYTSTDYKFHSARSKKGNGVFLRRFCGTARVELNSQMVIDNGILADPVGCGHGGS